MKNMLKDSRFWKPLWKLYPTAPSIALCRVPELEYAASLSLKGKVLDHCCGDGRFASLAWGGKCIYSGCDMNARSIERCKMIGMYERNDICDVSENMPYDDNSFDIIFNNSGLEHIENLDNALQEVSRVLGPSGVFAFNVLNHRYFEWWPRSREALNGYRKWQPFYHAFSLEQWTERLMKVGLRIVSVEGYFDREAAEELARLDHSFSSMHIMRKPVPPYWWYINVPYLMPAYWQKRLGSLNWKTDPDSGAGYFIKAIHA